MENEFLASLQQEGRIDQPAEEQKKEEANPSTPPVEKPEKDETAPLAEDNKPKDEGVVTEGETPKIDEPAVFQAFHKHPRWIALQTELKELRGFREEASPLLERLGQKPDNRKEETNVEIPLWFSEIAGENQEAWNKYRAYDAGQRETLRSEIIGEIQQAESKRVSDQKNQEAWVDKELQGLQDDGKVFNRNELLKIALEYLPTDESGNISFLKAFNILEKTKAGGQKPIKPISDEKKKIADQTMEKGKTEEGKKDYKTSADLRGKTFHDLIPEN